MPFEGLPDADQILRQAWALGLSAPPRRSVAEWAEAERVLGAEEGRYPGRWSTALTPYLRQPMECMSLHHPSRRVAIVAGAQSAKTQALLNLGGQIAAETPTTVLWVLPTIDEARKFNRTKLQPMIENSPAVRRRVMREISRDETGSTIMCKRFPGGSIELTGANSSKGLQALTCRVVIADEVAEFPSETGSRGDPLGQAEARTMSYTGEEKIILASTPGLEQGDPGPNGRCRITQEWEAGSRGRFMFRCRHCEHLQEPQFEQLRWKSGERAGHYACDGCGVLLDEFEFRALVNAGEYEHERPELVASFPTFRWNCLHSPFLDWATIIAKAEEAAADPGKAKTFSQQWLARPFKPALDVPKPELLRERQEARDLGRIPPGVLFLMAATDVQAHRLEWAVWGFDRHMSQYDIDGGIIVGDTNLPQVWEEHDALLSRTWPDAWGREWAPECWGIDSGFRTQAVYRFVRRYAWRPRPKVMALDGRPRWGLAPIGTARAQDVDFQGHKIGEVELWPVGTWDLKSELATALALTVQGPDGGGAWPRGALRFARGRDFAFYQSLTAEACVTVISAGAVKQIWRKTGPNEQLDLAVYTRALARHASDRMSEQAWQALQAERLGPPEAAQADLAQLWAPDLKAMAEAAAKRKAEDDTKREEAARQPPPPATIWGPSPRWEAPRPW